MGIESVNLAQSSQPIKTKDSMAQAQSFGSAAAVATVPDTYEKSTAAKKGLLIGAVLSLASHAISWSKNTKSLEELGKSTSILSRLPKIAVGASIAGAIGLGIGAIIQSCKNKSKK